jgi:ribosome-associated toxin RatA of RatAB toxin-antitoxin module
MICRRRRVVCDHMSTARTQFERAREQLSKRQSLCPAGCAAHGDLKDAIGRRGPRAVWARLALAFALAFTLTAARPAAAANITVDAERDGESIDIRASAVLNADAATAWQVLTDYGRYTDFVPDLHLSRVVARRGATVTVEQSGDAALWLFRMPLDITFEINEIPPYRLQSRAVAGSLRALTSSYALTPAASGLRLDYVGRAAPGYALFGRIEQAVIEHNVARQFQALADEIERQSAIARSRAIAVVK